MKDRKYDFIDSLLVMKYYLEEKTGYFSNRFGDGELIYPYIDFLNEGLVATYPLNKLMNKIENILGYCYKCDYFPYIHEGDKMNLMWIEGGNFSDNILNGVLHVHIGHEENIDNITECIKIICDACGYFLNSIDKDKCNISIESKIGKDVSNDIRRANNYLYHITPSIYVDKILKEGLCPSSKTDRYYYPNRIYLFTDSILNKYKLVANMLYIDKKDFYDVFDGDREKYEEYKKRGKEPKQYSLIKIDLNGIKSPIFLDGNFKQEENIIALYVTDNISPKYISIEDNFKIETKTISDQIIDILK